jgi:hypothetical protein
MPTAVRRPHPREIFDQQQIARAAYWTACQFLGVGRYDTRRAATLDDARAVARGMPADLGGVLIYAVTPEGWSIHVENVLPGGPA